MAEAAGGRSIRPAMGDSLTVERAALTRLVLVRIQVPQPISARTSESLYPGEVIRRQCLEPLGLSVTEAAKGLGVSRNTLSMLLNGRLGMSPTMAIRLSRGFGGSPESWLQQQAQYDLWLARQGEGKIKVRKFQAA